MSSGFIQTLFHFLKLQLSWRKKQTVRKLTGSTAGQQESRPGAIEEGVPPLKERWKEEGRRQGDATSWLLQSRAGW